MSRGIAATLLSLSLIQALLGTFVREIFENSTSFLSVDKLVSLVGTEDYDLSLINPKSNLNIQVSYEKMYNEHGTLQYNNESFVDSFGFRLGDISTNNFQVVLTTKTIYLYNLTLLPGSASLALRFVNKWLVNPLVDKQQMGQIFEANSTTTSVQTDTHMAEFVMIVVSQTGVSERFLGVRLDCPSSHSGINCSLSVTIDIPITPLIFSLLTNSSQGMTCNSTLRYLNTTNGSSSPLPQTGEREDPPNASAEFYFARFCKFTQLPYYQRTLYTSSVQIFKKFANNTIQKPFEVREVQSNLTSYPVQVVNLAEFDNKLILFSVTATFIIPLTGLNSTAANASQVFKNNYIDQQYTGQVECQQNDFNVLSCYQHMYSFLTLTLTPRLRLLQLLYPSCPVPDSLLADIVQSDQDGCQSWSQEPPMYVTPMFTEFIKADDQLFRIPPITLTSVQDGEALVAIDLNFLVFRRDIPSLQDLPSQEDTLLKILQRGTSANLGTVLTKNHVFAMKPLGPNFLMYRESDIGLIFKSTDPSNTSRFNATIYTIQLPYFKIDSGPVDKSAVCFAYLKNCQQLYFNFTYSLVPDSETISRHSPVFSKPVSQERMSLVVPFYHVNQNFSSTLPKSDDSRLMVSIQRDLISINISSSFYGLQENFTTSNEENIPQTPLSGLNIPEAIDLLDNFYVNITGIESVVKYTGEKIRDSPPDPWLSRYSDGTFFMSVFFLTEPTHNYPLGRIYLAKLPDRIDSTLDTEYIFTFSSLDAVMAGSMLSNLQQAVISTEAIPGMHYYFLYSGTDASPTYIMTIYKLGDGTFADIVEVPQVHTFLWSKVRVYRSSDPQGDDCLVLFNRDNVRIYSISYNNEVQSTADCVKLSLALEFSSSETSFEWPLGVPDRIIDVTLADYNALYVTAEMLCEDCPLGILNAVLVYQCDFFNYVPSCFFYTWVPLNKTIRDFNNNKIYVDNKFFDFAVLELNTLDFKLFKMTQFRESFMNMAKRELKPTRVINLRRQLQDDCYELYDLSNADRSFRSMSPVFGIPLTCVDKPFRSGILLFDFGEGLTSFKFYSLNMDNKVVLNIQTSPPNTAPMVYWMDQDDAPLSVVMLNPSLVFSFRSPQYLLQGDTYQTEVFQLRISSPGGVDFLQDFQGQTSYNFSLIGTAPKTSQKKSLPTSSLLQGFTQNLTIYCAGGVLGDWTITRNFSTLISCPDSSNKTRDYSFVPYIQKDFDFIQDLASFSPRASQGSPSTRGLRVDPLSDDLGGIVDSFRLSNGNEYIFLLHNFISIVHAENYSRIIAFVELFEEDDLTPLSMRSCLSIDENTLINDTLAVELICEEGENYMLYDFSLNFTYLQFLAQSESQALTPVVIRTAATGYLFWDILLSQYVTKDSEIMFSGGVFYVLDSILVESYNDRPYLNAYTVVRTNYTEEGELSRRVSLNLAWSSLSVDSLANANITKFIVLKDAQETDTFRNYSLFIVMQNAGSNSISYSINRVLVSVGANSSMNASIILGPQVPLAAPEFANGSSPSVKLFTSNQQVYIFLFNEDTIQEWVSLQAQPFTRGPLYRYLLVCDPSTSKEMVRYSDFFLLYCFNSTSDGTSDDEMLLFNSSLNRIPSPSGTVLNPIQQLILPDVEYPSNMLLSLYLADPLTGQVKLLLANPRTFITQYSLNPLSSLHWNHDSLRSGVKINVNLAAENVLINTTVPVAFQVRLLTIVEEYFEWVFLQGALVVVCLLYALAMLALHLVRKTHEERFGTQDSQEELFVTYYQKIMRNEALKDNLNLEEHPDDKPPLLQPLLPK